MRDRIHGSRNEMKICNIYTVYKKIKEKYCGFVSKLFSKECYDGGLNKSKGIPTEIEKNNE